MDVAEMQARFSETQPRVERVVEFVRGELSDKLKSSPECRIEGRAKEWPSFLKKVVRKGYADPWNDVHDRAGVRVTVPAKDFIPGIADLVHRHFDVVRDEDKEDALPPSELGYLGRHLDVRLDKTRPKVPPELDGSRCEIQVHTRVQNAWSELAHEWVYKRPVELPSKVARAIYRLLALVELFDAEVDRVKTLIRENPAFVEAQMLEVLEPRFFALAGRDYDRRLSLVVLDGLKHAYEPAELAMFEGVLDAFLETHGQKVEVIFQRYANAHSAPLVFQPESLAVFERIETVPLRLRADWDERLPPELLDELSAIWGKVI